jgi:hypothetical protein
VVWAFCAGQKYNAAASGCAPIFGLLARLRWLVGRKKFKKI